MRARPGFEVEGMDPRSRLKRRLLAILCAAALLLLGAAMCWRWNGEHTLNLRTNEADRLLRSGSVPELRAAMLRLYVEAERTVKKLHEFAQREDIVGQNCRDWLNRLHEATERR